MANVVLIYLAQDHAPSLVVDDYYERGQDYEKNMLKRMAMTTDWQMELLPPDQVTVAEKANFRFKLTTKEGGAVAPDSVTLYAYRPADAAADFSSEMRPLGPDLFETDIGFPLLGVWDLLISVRKGESEFNLPYRVNAAAQ
jgi:nitrogen fixation protein FixH